MLRDASSSWKVFLETYSATLLADENLRKCVESQFEHEGAAPSDGLGFPGASETDLTTAEERLGKRLPPSYRQFLAASNGWRMAGWNVWNLWSSHEVTWFRDRYPEWLRDWRDASPVCDTGADIDAEELQHMLAVSEASNTNEIYLLNPRVVTGDEWQALVFSDAIPGAQRYPNFRALMEAELERFKSEWLQETNRGIAR